MKKNKRMTRGFFIRIFIAAAIFAALFAGPSETAQNVVLKVGVADGVSSGKIIGEGIVITDAKGVKGAVKNGAAITARGKGIAVGKTALALPAAATAADSLGWNNVRYRGRLLFIKAGNGFTVVNEIDLENYVRGVLKMEMSADWPLEALKAQAVLARTYALRNRGRFAKRGYDFDAGENSQVYRGRSAESPATDKAVSDTAGLILTWNGTAADVYYHSDSGGATADVAHVWGSGRPYLTVRQEPVAYASPNSTWQTALSEAQMSSVAQKMGLKIGRVKTAEIASADSAGRAIALRLIGDRGTAVVKAHDFRMAAGSRVIKSTNFDIARSAPPDAPQTRQAASSPPAAAAPNPMYSPRTDPLTDMVNAGVFTSKELMDMLLNPSKKGEYLQIGLERTKDSQTETPPEPETPPPPPPSPAEKTTAAGTGDFIFSGRGWGHGVGLSQWGAKAMAEAGMKCEEILAHYFPGTKIGR